MNPAQLLQLLQISDSLFPVGAFAFSDGMETAVAFGDLNSGDGVEEWLADYLELVFAPCDGLACAKAMVHFDRGEWEQLGILDMELTAIKPGRAIRASSHSIGKRFLVSWGAVYSGPRTPGLQDLNNLAVIYGCAAKIMNFEVRDAVLAFGYSRLAGLVSAAQRLMPLGQQQAQLILTRRLRELPGVAERITTNIDIPISSFVPLLDVRQMNHRHVYSRMFRS